MKVGGDVSREQEDEKPRMVVRLLKVGEDVHCLWQQKYEEPCFLGTVVGLLKIA